MSANRRKFLKTSAATLLALGGTRAGAQVGVDPVRQAGQRIIIGFAGTTTRDPGVQRVMRDLAQGVISGVVLFQRNITSSGQLRKLTGALREVSGTLAPIIAVDNEGGAITRTSGARGFRDWLPAQQVAARCTGRRADCVNGYYLARAKQLAKAGINLNLAPVVDLNINARNPIIGGLGRSFSSDPSIVANAAAQFIKAHRAAGVATCLKHFPGHGSASADSHLGLPDITDSWTRAELSPFRALVSAELADAVMMAHLFHRDHSDGRFVPTSLSRKTMEILRRDIGFNGVVITDDMQMGAIRNAYAEGQSVRHAIAAGNDLLIFGNFQTGELGLGARINQTVRSALAEGAQAPAAQKASEDRILAFRRKLS